MSRHRKCFEAVRRIDPKTRILACRRTESKELDAMGKPLSTAKSPLGHLTPRWKENPPVPLERLLEIEANEHDPVTGEPVLFGICPPAGYIALDYDVDVPGLLDRVRKLGRSLVAEVPSLTPGRLHIWLRVQTVDIEEGRIPPTWRFRGQLIGHVRQPRDAKSAGYVCIWRPEILGEAMDERGGDAPAASLDQLREFMEFEPVKRTEPKTKTNGALRAPTRSHAVAADEGDISARMDGFRSKLIEHMGRAAAPVGDRPGERNNKLFALGRRLAQHASYYGLGRGYLAPLGDEAENRGLGQVETNATLNSAWTTGSADPEPLEERITSTPIKPRPRASKPNGLTRPASPAVSTTTTTAGGVKRKPGSAPNHAQIARMALDEIEGAGSRLLIDGEKWSDALLFLSGEGWVDRLPPDTETGIRKSIKSYVGKVCDAVVPLVKPGAQPAHHAIPVRSALSELLRICGCCQDWDVNPGVARRRGRLFDFHAGTSRAIRRTDFIRKSMRGNPLKGKTQKKRQQRLHGILTDWLGSEDVIDFMQRYLGACLAGYAPELNKFMIIHGAGLDGKSTFMESVAHAVGDYAVKAHEDVFQKTLKEHESYTVELRGARFVFVSEFRTDAQLNLMAVKKLTGNERISTRALRRENEQTVPTWGVIMAMNNLPEVATVDRAIRRRALVVPFQRIPAEKEDLTLGAQIKRDLLHAVAHWIADGAKKFVAARAKGGRADDILNVPDSVVTATERWLAKVDYARRYFWTLDREREYLTIEIKGGFDAYCASHSVAATKPRKELLDDLMRSRFRYARVRRGDEKNPRARWIPKPE